MDGEPGGADLLETVAAALRETVVPALSGEARYHALMAASAVAMVARETRGAGRLAAAVDAAAAALGPHGIAALRAGRHDADPAVHEALRRLAVAATAVTRPAALTDEEARLPGAGDPSG